MMNSSQKQFIHCVSVGEPPKKKLSDVGTVKFIIYNFRERGVKPNEWIRSPEVSAHGLQWSIGVGLKGEYCLTNSDFIFCGLNLESQANVSAMLSFRCKGHERSFETPTRFADRVNGWGVNNFLKLESIENYLEEDGSLIIEVDIQIAAKSKRVWYPKELERQDMWVELYQGESCSETSDIVFSIGGTEYLAHKLVLYLRAKKLFEIVKTCDNDMPIPIPAVRGEIFEKILEFVYTIKTPEIENDDIATELLIAADRFGCANLKLYVESVLVDKFLTVENAAALFILGDSQSCALLKEAAKNTLATNITAVTKSEAWSKIKKSTRMLEELLCSFSSGDMDFTMNRFDVTSLREKLEEADLELDGSREELLTRLKAHQDCQLKKH